LFIRWSVHCFQPSFRELVSLFVSSHALYILYLISSIHRAVKMYFQAASLAALIAVAHARFGQEQIPIPAIAAVQGGAPGVAQTIAGAAVSDLLAATNACDKLKRGDQIISELGTGADAITAAIGIVAAEKNFNPFAQSIPTICDDPTLPATDVLRGITPLIDPAVVGSDVANALSARPKSLLWMLQATVLPTSWLRMDSPISPLKMLPAMPVLHLQVMLLFLMPELPPLLLLLRLLLPRLPLLS
jgi:hypothetical protein